MIEDIGAKIMGAFWGAVVALLFMPPKTKQEAARRGLATIIMGTIATPVLFLYFGWPMTTDFIVASSAAIACLSWFLLPVAMAGSRTLLEAGLRVMEKMLQK